MPTVELDDGEKAVLVRSAKAAHRQRSVPAVASYRRSSPNWNRQHPVRRRKSGRLASRIVLIGLQRDEHPSVGRDSMLFCRSRSCEISAGKQGGSKHGGDHLFVSHLRNVLFWFEAGIEFSINALRYW